MIKKNLFVLLIIFLWSNWSVNAKDPEDTLITLRVDGLACPFCAYGLEKKVTKIKNVISYDVDMREGKVLIGFRSGVKINFRRLEKAVKEAGFSLRTITLKMRGKIQKAKEGLIFVTEKERFLLQKHKDSKIEIQIPDTGKGVLIEGIVKDYKKSPVILSIINFDIIH